MTPTQITVHAASDAATILDRSPQRIVATDGISVETFSLRKSGRWVRVGDPDVWGAHRLQGGDVHG